MGHMQTSRPVSMEDKSNLPYTEAVIQEVLRFACIAPLAIDHFAQADIHLGKNKYFIPKGTVILPNLHRITRNAQMFPNPEKFMPERFLNQDGKYVKHDHNIPFGIGKRDCLGKSLALTEFFLFFANLMQRYNFKAVNEDLKRVNIKPIVSFTQTPHPFEVIIEKRMMK